MAQTQFKGNQVADGSIRRADMDVSTPGSAVVVRLIAGAGISLASTGPDAGTGDVTVTATGGGGGGLTYQQTRAMMTIRGM